MLAYTQSEVKGLPFPPPPILLGYRLPYITEFVDLMRIFRIGLNGVQR